MSRIVAFRAVLQRPSGEKNKYYVGVIGGSITHAYPFKVSVADITVQSTAGGDTQYYMAPIAIDDIVRIQVNLKYKETEPDVWQDLFEGRIRRVDNSFSKAGSVTKLNCTGHGNPLTYTYFSSDQTFTSQTSGYIVNAMIPSLARFTDASPSLIDQVGSTTITEYTVKANGKTFADVINDLETYELDGYAFRVKAVYDADDNLDEVNPVWEAIGEITDVTEINEGGGSLISAAFQSEDRMVNKVVVVGDGVSAIAEDTTLQATYDVRQQTYVDTSITSTSSAQEAADAILARWKLPVITGTVVIKGDPNIQTGYRVNCYIPSICLEGAEINDDFMVRQVQHSLGPKFETTLTLGETSLDAAELIYILLNTNKRNNLNNV